MEEGKLATKRRAVDTGIIGMMTITPAEKRVKFDASSSPDDSPTEATALPAKPKTATKKTSLLYSKAKVNALKPKAGSWLPHIAASVIDRVVMQAMNKAIDPRVHMDAINFDSWGSQILSGDDLKKIWVYISREYPPSVPLMVVLEELQPYSKVTFTDIHKDELKAKYKDLMPKAPYSPYFLFTHSKLPKFKAKHPELTQTEIAVKLGQKWKSLGAEQQKKYQTKYVLLKEEYLKEMEIFFEEHPDARPLVESSKKSKAAKSSKKVAVPLTAEEEKLRYLKSIAPKPTVSAYISFCNKKRDKVHTRHPELSPTEITIKLGKKWKSLGQDERLKYQRHYEESHAEYKKRLSEFHLLHPEAKEMLKRKPKTKVAKTTTNLSSLSALSSPSPTQQVLNSVQQNGTHTPDEHEVEEELEDEDVPIKEEEEEAEDEVETEEEETEEEDCDDTDE